MNRGCCFTHTLHVANTPLFPLDHKHTRWKWKNPYRNMTDILNQPRGRHCRDSIQFTNLLFRPPQSPKFLILLRSYVKEPQTQCYTYRHNYLCISLCAGMQEFVLVLGGWYVPVCTSVWYGNEIVCKSIGRYALTGTRGSHQKIWSDLIAK